MMIELAAQAAVRKLSITPRRLTGMAVPIRFDLTNSENQLY